MKQRLRLLVRLVAAGALLTAAVAQAQPQQAPAFVPPPRTIGDITAILDQQKPDPAKTAAAKAAADAQPRPGMSAGELSRFFYDRGLAARELGRTKQSLDDFRASVRHGQEARYDVGRALEALYAAEVRYGNARTAAEIAEDMARTDRRRGGPEITIANYLVSTRLRLGDIDGAQKAMLATERLLRERIAQPQSGGRIFGDLWTGFVKRTAATLMLETGRPVEAEQAARESVAAYDRAIPRYDEMAASTTLFIFPRGQMEKDNELNRAVLVKTLLAQGRVTEAEVESRRSLLNLLARFGRYSAETGGAISILASVLLEEGRLSEAETLAGAAVDSLEHAGAGTGSTSLATAYSLLARTQTARKHWADARATFARLESAVADDAANQATFVSGNVMLGLVQVKTGAAVQAVTVMEQAVALRARRLGERHIDTAEARGFLGLALAATGQRDRALVEFRAAVPILLQSSRQSDDEAGASARDQRAQLILESYMGVLADSRGGAEAAAESFRLADAARGRSVQRALAAASARAAANPALAELARREQDAQKQIGALQGLLANLLSSPTDQQDPGAIKSLREQIDKLRDERARMREELDKRFPDYVNLIDPRPATIEQARAALKTGEALISTYVGAERSFVWAVPRDGAPAFAAAALKERDVETMVRNLRRSLDPNAATLGDIPAFDTTLANRLYAALLAPVAAGWQNARSLLIVPHKALGQLPFGLLVTEATKPAEVAGQALFAAYKTVPFLIRKAAVTQLPTVTALVTLRALPAGDPSRKAFVGFGDPWFNARQAAEARAPAAQVAQTAGVQTRGLRLVRRNAPATQSVNSADLALLPRLPDTAEEVRNVALALNADLTRDVFLGAQANEQAVRTMNLADRKVVLFATHGLVPGDLNGLTQPALALSAPGIANSAGDGLLTMEDILGLRLNADWVVLSACNTASGEGAGAEAVSGLGRAFFYAGARALLVSNWPVETVSARALTTDLFKRQAAEPTLGRAEALRRSMIALIDGPGAVDSTGKPQFSYAHPIFWGPFSVVGDGA